MVKKISGSTPSRPTAAATGVKANQSVQNTKEVDSVQQVSGVQQQSRVEKIRRPTRPMTVEERQHLLELVDEEADKLFGAKGIPESKRQTLTQAVKLTVAAGVIDLEEDEKKS